MTDNIAVEFDSVTTPFLSLKLRIPKKTHEVVDSDDDISEAGSAGSDGCPSPELALYDIDLCDKDTTSLLGRGAFGSVYRSRYVRHTVAVKVLDLRQEEDHAETVERFVAEVAAISRISHPNCVRFLGASLDVATLAMVTEYCPNGDLANVIHSVGFLSREEQLVFLLDIAKGMAYLHERGMVHRDLKPENVLLDANFMAKVADFGLSTTNPTDTSMVFCGTRAYMAPEVLRSQQNEKPADVWSYATLAWEMFTSIRPPSGRGNVYAPPGNFTDWEVCEEACESESGSSSVSSGGGSLQSPMMMSNPAGGRATVPSNGSFTSAARRAVAFARISSMSSLSPSSSSGSSRRSMRPSVSKATLVSTDGFDEDVIVPWPTPVADVLLQAWNATPLARPSFVEIVNSIMLGKRLVQLQTAIDARDVSTLKPAYGGGCVLARAHWVSKDYIPHYLATHGVVSFQSALHVAVAVDDISFARKLLYAGIPPSDMDINGKTPLCLAKSPAMRKLLIAAHGAILEGPILIKRGSSWHHRYAHIEGFRILIWNKMSDAHDVVDPQMEFTVDPKSTVSIYQGHPATNGCLRFKFSFTAADGETVMLAATERNVQTEWVQTLRQLIQSAIEDQMLLNSSNPSLSDTSNPVKVQLVADDGEPESGSRSGSVSSVSRSRSDTDSLSVSSSDSSADEDMTVITPRRPEDVRAVAAASMARARAAESQTPGSVSVRRLAARVRAGKGSDFSFMCRMSSGSQGLIGSERRVFKIPTDVMYMIDAELVTMDEVNGSVTAIGSIPLVPSLRGQFLFADVMIKVFKVGELSGGQAEALLEVLAMVSGVTHPNTVPTVGVVMDEEHGRVAVVSEVMEPTNLFDAMRSDQMASSRMVLLHYACEIAKGVERLHQLGVTHGNLHPHNVLFDERNTVRISNFGVAQLYMVIYRDPERLRRALHPLYAAPEILDGSGPIISMAGDLWSLAVVIWSCFYISFGVLSLPYGGDRYAGSLYRAPGNMDAHAPEDIIALLSRAFTAAPENRPTASEYVQVLLAHINDAVKNPLTAWGRQDPWLVEGGHGLEKRKADDATEDAFSKTRVYVDSARASSTYVQAQLQDRTEFDRATHQDTARDQIRSLLELTTRLQANAGIFDVVVTVLTQLVASFDDARLEDAPRRALYSLTSVILKVIDNARACNPPETRDIYLLGATMLHRITANDDGKVAVRTHGGAFVILALLHSPDTDRELLLTTLLLLVRLAYNDGNRDHLCEIGMLQVVTGLLDRSIVRADIDVAGEVVNAIAFLALTMANKIEFGRLNTIDKQVALMAYWYHKDLENKESDLIKHGFRGLGNMAVFPDNGLAIAVSNGGVIFEMIEGIMASLDDTDIFWEGALRWIGLIWCLNSMCRTVATVKLVPESTITRLINFLDVIKTVHYRGPWIVLHIIIRLCGLKSHREFMRTNFDIESLAFAASKHWPSFPAVAILAERAAHDVGVLEDDDVLGPPSLDAVEANATV